MSAARNHEMETMKCKPFQQISTVRCVHIVFDVRTIVSNLCDSDTYFARALILETMIVCAFIKENYSSLLVIFFFLNTSEYGIHEEHY